ncbi:GFA family protein [Sinorhizobium meliloti]|uniref:GFA family protein n=1 Tax=Rhizobium meliloti TaxID=382 RepID=UPI000FDC6656|nr:GFA family protein [Sinorhizobium meliloti]RVG78019.1 hypothetical protein CN219_29250 [Sinorhizobium meliloti]RVI32114.1 hypothetical protein CN197_19925 [Sinorhizobium meliloti]RVI43975.1 hypothetical protein CN196_17255 [Sinorhizobium meliloti]RVJ18825.1 hypothetical protein CN177_26675 [Sinorhizobium meliloti]RVJ92637.1 hypothetical protein CN170_25830 [Sinorhizobium meliloti]
MRHRIEGHCDCGATRYVCMIEDAEIVACGCLECRRPTAVEQTKALKVSCEIVDVDGRHAMFAARADGRHITHSFCEVCGSPLYYRDDTEPEVIFLTVDRIASQRALN